MNKPIPVEIAQQRMLESVSPVFESEYIPLAEALGRTLKADVIAPMDLPPFRSSAMDGYAFRKSSRQYQCTGTSLAGHPFSQKLKDGECVRIFTGALIPKDADVVIPQELVVRKGDTIYLEEEGVVGANIRPQGRDYQKGQLLLPAGSRLTPINIALLASAGIQQVDCCTPVKVALMTSGDELIEGHQELPNGCVYESNLLMIKALLSQASCEVTQAVRLPDDPVRISAALDELAATAQVLITIGGASVGETDFIRSALAEHGQIGFWRVAIKPGMPVIFGQIRQTVFFGLPGNPVSAFVTFGELVAPCLAKMGGIRVPETPRFYATLQRSVQKNTRRVEFQRGWL